MTTYGRWDGVMSRLSSPGATPVLGFYEGLAWAEWVMSVRAAVEEAKGGDANPIRRAAAALYGPGEVEAWLVMLEEIRRPAG